LNPIAHQKKPWHGRKTERQNDQDVHQNVEHDFCPMSLWDSPPAPTKMPLGLSDLRMRIDVFLLISDVARRSAQALTNR
jgi:hypothetical protein